MHRRANIAIFIAAACAGCAGRSHPYRFASPMLGTAALPASSLSLIDAPRGSDPRRDPMPREEPREGAREEIDPRAASAAAADAIAHAPAALARGELPRPHRLATDALPPVVRSPDELRGLVGRRDKRASIAAALAWSRELADVRPPLPTDAVTGTELVAWAERGHRLLARTEPPMPGDLLVFDRAVAGEPADLVAVAVATDARGVTELVYVGGGVVRRGFLDADRPDLRRDADGAVVNTYLRHGKRWPPKGTRYLAGELLAHVIR